MRIIVLFLFLLFAQRLAATAPVIGTTTFNNAFSGSGALGLRNALAVIDCAVEEIIERHSHGIILGAVKSVRLGHGPNRDPLVYGHGRFAALKLS